MWPVVCLVYCLLDASTGDFVCAADNELVIGVNPIISRSRSHNKSSRDRSEAKRFILLESDTARGLAAIWIIFFIFFSLLNVSRHAKLIVINATVSGVE